jgi:DNA-binding NtrC family response regulator
VLLARHFLARAAAACGVEPPAMEPALTSRLLAYPWPGNVRELANGCAYAVKVAGARGTVDGSHWPEMEWNAGPDSRERPRGLHAETRALEERRLREALERTRWNKSRAARALGLSRQGLLKKLRRYGLMEIGAAEGDVEMEAPLSPA